MAPISDVKLWVRPEVLELGVIPILPPDKISVEVSEYYDVASYIGS